MFFLLEPSISLEIILGYWVHYSFEYKWHVGVTKTLGGLKFMFTALEHSLRTIQRSTVNRKFTINRPNKSYAYPF